MVILIGLLPISIIITVIITVAATIITDKKPKENIFINKLNNSNENINENHFYKNLMLTNGVNKDTK